MHPAPVLVLVFSHQWRVVIGDPSWVPEQVRLVPQDEVQEFDGGTTIDVGDVLLANKIYLILITCLHIVHPVLPLGGR